MTILDYKIDRFATKVTCDKDPAIYDAIELQGVRHVSGSAHSPIYEVDNDNPDEFSVYLHEKDAGVVCVGDFTRYIDALQYALELSDELSLEVSDYARPK